MGLLTTSICKHLYMTKAILLNHRCLQTQQESVTAAAVEEVVPTFRRSKGASSQMITREECCPLHVRGGECLFSDAARQLTFYTYLF